MLVLQATVGDHRVIYETKMKMVPSPEAVLDLNAAEFVDTKTKEDERDYKWYYYYFLVINVKND